MGQDKPPEPAAYSARVNNYWQGGTDNCAAGRPAASAGLAASLNAAEASAPTMAWAGVGRKR